MAVATPSTAKAILAWRSGGIPWFNVLHFYGTPTEHVNLAFANSVMTRFSTWVGQPGTFFAPQTTLLSATVVDLRVVGSPPFSSTVGPQNGGAIGTAPYMLPNQLCVAATITTALHTRRGRGRLYFSGLATKIIQPTGLGHIDPQLLTNWNDGVALTGLFPVVAGILTDTGWLLSVLSKADNVNRIFDQIRVRDTRFDVQRRRGQ